MIEHIENRNIMNIQTFEAGITPLLFGLMGIFVGKMAFSSAMVVGEALWIELTKLLILFSSSMLGVYLKNIPTVNAFFRNIFKKKGKKHGGNR